jgi:membrane dipeptidase
MRRFFWAVVVIMAMFAIASFAISRTIEPHYNRVLRSSPYHASAAAQELHRTLFISDLHADSLLWGRDLRQRSATGHLDFPRLREANISLQTFTVVTTIPGKLNIEHNESSSDMVRYLAIANHWPVNTWSSPKNRALYQAKRLHQFADESKGQIVILRSRRDLVSLKPHQIAVFLGAEGAQPLEGNLDNLDTLYAAGFRMMSPTHFTDTVIGGSASGAHKGGLTALGREWVRAMESKKMIIDLAHASPATIHDVTTLATRPVVVSHTGVKGTCNNNRNLSDDQLRAVTRTGGVVGIGYWQNASCGTDAAAVARAIRYAAGVVGVEHVALGSDFDGATTMPFDVTGLPTITDALLKERFSEKDIRLIMGENVRRVLLEDLPE